MKNESKLPVWRVIAGFGMLVAFLGVLGALAPVYVDNYKLARYVRSLDAAQSSQSLPDRSLQAQVTARARELDLPVTPADVHIIRAEGRPHIEAVYRVELKLLFYPVDLHVSAR